MPTLDFKHKLKANNCKYGDNVKSEAVTLSPNLSAEKWKVGGGKIEDCKKGTFNLGKHNINTNTP